MSFSEEVLADLTQRVAARLVAAGWKGLAAPPGPPLQETIKPCFSCRADPNGPLGRWCPSVHASQVKRVVNRQVMAYRVECINCGACGPFSDNIRDGASDEDRHAARCAAISKWNWVMRETPK